jgi:hypothetical protein
MKKTRRGARRVSLYRSILPVQCRLFLQLRKYRYVAANVETGHKQTPLRFLMSAEADVRAAAAYVVSYPTL